MMEGFTALAFGFCAAIVNVHGQELIEIGDIISSECRTFAYVSEGSGELRNHDFTIEFFTEGAIVTVDGKRFVLPKTEGA